MRLKSDMRVAVNIVLLAILVSCLIVNRFCQGIFYNVFRCLGISTKRKFLFTPFALKPLQSLVEISYDLNS